MKQPNILFIFPDQHRGDWLPFSPEEVGEAALPLRMEHLRSLMDRGMTFRQTYTSSPLCAPARASLATGRNYDRCGVWNNNQCCPLDVPTFYRALRDAGYRVGGVGKFDIHKPINHWGRSGWLSQYEVLGFTDAVDNEGKWDGFWATRTEPGPYGRYLEEQGLTETFCRDFVNRYFDPNETTPTKLPQEAYADDWETDNALHFLEEYSKEERPWFLMVNYSGPHDPWDVTEEMSARWEGVKFPLPEEWTGDPEQLQAIRRCYAAMLENIDRNLGRLLDAVEAMGQTENTVVIYASDHGEMLGNHNRFYKSVPYTPSVHIPLIMAGPGIRRGSTDCLVQLNDLAATIPALAGTVLPGGNDAQSLLPLAAGGADPVRDYVTFGLYPTVKRAADRCPGYEELAQYEKNMGGPERIEDFLEAFDLPPRTVPAVRQEKKLDWRAVFDGEWKLVDYPTVGDCSLFHLVSDPNEQMNLAQQRPEIAERLRQLLPHYPVRTEPVR